MPTLIGGRALASALLLTLLTTTACGSAPSNTWVSPPARGAGTPAGPTPGSAAATRAAALANTLSDIDLVGQVLMPYAYGSSATEVTTASAAGNQALAGVDTPAEMVREYRLGGLILVGFSADDPTSKNQPTTNVDSAAQVRALTAGLQRAGATLAAAGPSGSGGPSAGALPLLIGTDQEYGVVVRITDGMTILPSAMAFGAAADPALTEAAWRAAGTELRALGINVDFAPVADVTAGNTGGAIGSRSYGSDAQAVARQVGAAVRGLERAGVAATLKHFPGHGHTGTDSHTDLPLLSQSRAELDRDDLPPFQAGITAGASMIMSGHLDVRAIDPGTAATFSRKVLTDVLRGQLGFTGVVVSDALNMEPAKRWPPGEAAVRALNAGNDLLLMPPDLAAARDGLLAGLRDGTLTRARLIEAVTRVLTLKAELADRNSSATPRPDVAANRAAVDRLTAGAVTVLRGSCTAPLPAGPVTVTSSGGRDRTRALLEGALRAAGVKVVSSGGRVVHLVGYGDGAADLRSGATVTVGMDTPYLLAGADSPVLIATYSSSAASMTALAGVLTGRARAPGRSPVPVSGLPVTACQA